MEEIITNLSGPEYAPSSGGKAKQLVILLHGLGSDGNDLISLAPEFSKVLPDTHFISPNAPFPCDMSPFGYQWFSLMSWDPEYMYKGANDAAPILNHFIDQCLERFNLPDKKLAFVGFSQGTMMSLNVALRRAKPCAGIVGYSGALLRPEKMANEIKSRPPICLIHGMADPVVPFVAMSNAEKSLKEMGINVQAHARPSLPHGIDNEGINIGKEFLSSVLL